MAFVVTENCVNCKFTDCVEECPVDCFHEGPNFLVINPDECIDCAMCEPACPAEAIVSEDDLTDSNREFLALNEKYSKQWPVISAHKEPSEDAKEWMNKPNKKDLIRES